MNDLINRKSGIKKTQQIVFIPKKLKAEMLADLKLDYEIVFEAESGEVLVLKWNKTKCFLVGLGEDSQTADLKRLGEKFSFDFRKKLDKKDSHFVFPKSFNAEQIKSLCIGLFKGTYEIKKNGVDFTHPLWNEEKSISLCQEGKGFNLESIVKEAQLIAEGQFFCMDLLNLAPNQKNSEILADFISDFAEQNDLKCSILDKQTCEEKGLSGFLAVNQGSAYAPAFIILEYIPENPVKKIGLVGKCVTFDTGGISIKPSQNMHYMKSDMGGATTVLGALLAAKNLKLNHHIVAILPATDNAVDKKSYLPGDVINTYLGKTIEVINTDAEGRMTLADGLAYMNQNYQPDILIDLATLTGSAVRTFGYKCAAFFSKNNNLYRQFSEIGEEIGEKVWSLPLWDEYLKDLQSDVADYKQISNTPLSDVIYAAKLLEQFTAEHPAWIHLDIAGVAFGNNAYSKDKSATGYGVQLLVEFMQKLEMA